MLSFGWVPATARKVGSYLTRRPQVPAPTAALERLQARKSQIGQQLDGRRAAARFEPEPAADGELAGRELPGDAIAVAMRYLAPPPGQYDSAMPVTHESGITLGYRRHYSTAKGKWFANFEALYGFAAGLTLGLSPILVP
jgi:hypothetical protein